VWVSEKEVRAWVSTPQEAARSWLTIPECAGRLGAYFSPSWTPFQADRGRDFSVIVDGVSN
jgi:hypothetical protein